MKRIAQTDRTALPNSVLLVQQLAHVCVILCVCGSHGPVLLACKSTDVVKSCRDVINQMGGINHRANLHCTMHSSYCKCVRATRVGVKVCVWEGESVFFSLSSPFTPSLSVSVCLGDRLQRMDRLEIGCVHAVNLKSGEQFCISDSRKSDTSGFPTARLRSTWLPFVFIIFFRISVK